MEKESLEAGPSKANPQEPVGTYGPDGVEWGWGGRVFTKSEEALAKKKGSCPLCGSKEIHIDFEHALLDSGSAVVACGCDSCLAHWELIYELEKLVPTGVALIATKEDPNHWSVE